MHAMDEAFIITFSRSIAFALILEVSSGSQSTHPGAL